MLKGVAEIAPQYKIHLTLSQFRGTLVTLGGMKMACKKEQAKIEPTTLKKANCFIPQMSQSYNGQQQLCNKVLIIIIIFGL